MIDNSGSMSAEIKGVQDNINKNFAQIIESSGIDYRVIMLSRFGKYTSTQICVEATAREAFHHGYRTVVVEDAVSSFAPDLHRATLANLAMKFGWVARADEVIANLPDPR